MAMKTIKSIKSEIRMIRIQLKVSEKVSKSQFLSDERAMVLLGKLQRARKVLV